MGLFSKCRQVYGTSVHTVIYDSDIFMTMNSTHLTVGGSNVAKIHKTTYSCFKNTTLKKRDSTACVLNRKTPVNKFLQSTVCFSIVFLCKHALDLLVLRLCLCRLQCFAHKAVTHCGLLWTIMEGGWGQKSLNRNAQNLTVSTRIICLR